MFQSKEREVILPRMYPSTKVENSFQWGDVLQASDLVMTEVNPKTYAFNEGAGYTTTEGGETKK